MITIGRMAEKYHMLPHEVEQRATTYDFMINDVLATYENYVQAKSKAKGGAIDPKLYNLSQEKLQAIMNKGKKKQ